MSKIIFEELFQKYLEDSISPEELAQFRELFQDDQYAALRDQLLLAAFTNKAYAETADHAPKEVFASLQARIGETSNDSHLPVQQTPIPSSGAPVIPLTPAPKIRIRWRAAAVAAIVLLLAGGIYLIRHRQPLADQLAINKNDLTFTIPPGKNGAILTLADGRQIGLDETKNGALTRQGNTSLSKQGAEISYQSDPAANKVSPAPAEVLYNTMTTPRGRQFQLRLPDGTRVWLNSASSIRYPTAFTGSSRRVEITGEAYFEVTSDAAAPFIVQAGEQELKVLGTHFNINAYSDETSIRTTLLEGSVKVSGPKGSTLLRPGEQTQLTKENGFSLTQHVDPDAAIAWKNGFFSFRHADIQTVMRQLSRWYDIDIRYEGTIKSDRSFSGEIGRSLELPDVLEGLQLTKIRYRIEGNKKLVIIP